MSVYMTMRVNVDPAVFEKQAAEQADVIRQIMGIATSKGLIAHRWFRGAGEIMAVDEWPDAESAQAFLAEAQPQIGPMMEACGVSAPPDVKFWDGVDIGDTFGWGA
ncbi:MAG TPA: hypothetical protein VNC22_15370 [Sporichthya sp.]|nr:hypothetical protein [Sporichthya sp.]